MNGLKQLAQLTVPEKTTRAARARRRRLIKKLADADNTIKRSKRRDYCQTVVTGCNHLAGMIGKSGTTGNKRLRQWEKQGIIQTQAVVEFTPAYSTTEIHSVVDARKASGRKGVPVYSRKEGGVKHIIGKRVISFVSSAVKIEFGREAEYLKGRGAARKRVVDDSSSYTFSQNM